MTPLQHHAAAVLSYVAQTNQILNIHYVFPIPNSVLLLILAFKMSQNIQIITLEMQLRIPQLIRQFFNLCKLTIKLQNFH